MTYVNLFYGWVRQEIFAIPGRIIAVIFLCFLFAAPLITQESYYLRIIILACIFAIFAMSWDVLFGFTGQLNLGHGLFFGAGAYAAAFLNLHLHWAPWLTIPAGAVIGLGFGLIVCIPALRLRGMYLGLVTLSLPIIAAGLLYVFPDVTGGELGLYGLEGLSRSINVSYYVVVVVFLVSAYIMYKLTDIENKHVRLGILFCAIREDEIAARTSGINTNHYKLIAFVVSGLFAGIAGGLYAHFLRSAGPSMLTLFFSFQVILWCTFGSTATIYGGVVGVFILYPMTEVLSLFQWGENLRYIIFALILMVTLFFMPEGITKWILDKLETKCPRCKLVNFSLRKRCRGCRAELNAGPVKVQ